MEPNETFKMTYSAEQQEEISRIRQKYIPQVPTQMEQLRALDAAASGRAARPAIIVGVIGTLIMGAGMSLVMSDFGSALGTLGTVIGILLGIAGMAVLAAAYPLYTRKLKKEREMAAPEILRLTDELMK